MSEAPIRVMLVDDHEVVREGLRTLLTNASSDGVQVREAENGRRAISEAAKFQPDVVVMDVAGSYSGYASDITRTLPASGHFTPRQREIYEIVLGAQNAALTAIKPGVMIGGRGKLASLQQIAFEYINTHGKDLHGKPLGQYFIHGLGHSVGLNVHDPAEYDQPLQAGMVITDEPGIYIPEEKLGVRIEDMVLVTQDGAELLTRRLPRTVEEVEKAMSQKQ